MPGNRVVFDEALRKSRDALERQQWLEALTEAVRAVQEVPGDLEARHTVAIALYHNTKYDQAAQLFEELRKHRGDDAVTLAYLARSYEGNRQYQQAVEVLLELAALTQQDGQVEDAREALSEAVRLAPQSEQPRLAMAQFFLDMGVPRHAAEQCLEIARLRHSAGDAEGAQEAIEETLALDPDNGNAHALRSLIVEATTPHRVPTDALLQRGGSGELQGPPAQIDHLIARAMQAQATGNGTEALNLYRKAFELGADRADVLYNLAMLYQERGEHEQAVPLFRQSAASEEFALSSFYALGESLRTLGRLREAVEAFDQSLRQVDLEGVGRGEADDLIAMFRSAAEAYEELGDLSRAASIYTTLAGFFHNKRWGRDLADQFKMRARSLNERSMVAKLQRIGTGALPGEVVSGSLHARSEERGTALSPTPTTLEPVTAQVDALRTNILAEDPFASLNLPEVTDSTFAPLSPLPTEGCSEEVLRYIAASGQFMDQGLIHAAIDACYEIVKLDPAYVPVHLRIGEINERDGMIEQALLKYRVVIDTYMVREQPLEAISAYYHLLDLSPDSLVPRGQLAQLLRTSGKIEEAVEQILLVADTLTRMGQHQRALHEYRQLLTWAPPSCRIFKAYGHTLLKMERWEEALRELLRAVRCAPSDPVALALVNIAVAIIGKDEQTIVGSLQSVIEQLGAQPKSTEAVIAEYRSALMLVDVSLLHYLLGRVQQATGQHASAMLSFRQALSLLSLEDFALLAPVVVHQALADSYLAQEQLPEALEELSNVQELLENPDDGAQDHPLRRGPSGFNVSRQIANVYVARGDQAEAIRAWKRCVQLEPNAVESYTQLADLYFRQGKLQSALDQYEWLANLYEQRQQLDEAIATLERAVALAPSSITLHERVSRLLLRRGFVERGLAELEEVIALEKAAGQIDEMCATMQQVAGAYELLSRYDDAATIYRSILEYKPDDLDVRSQLVNVLLLQGAVDQAIAEQRCIAQWTAELNDRNARIEALSQLVALDPDDPDAAEQLAEAAS